MFFIINSDVKRTDPQGTDISNLVSKKTKVLGFCVHLSQSLDSLNTSV